MKGWMYVWSDGTKQVILKQFKNPEMFNLKEIPVEITIKNNI